MVSKSEAKRLVEQLVNGKVKSLTEVVTKTDSCGGTKFVTDNTAKAREIVETHFAAMTAELEAAGISSFDASVDDGYARISFGRGCC